MARALLTDTVKTVLASSGGLRISCKGLLADTMMEYAAFAASGNARLGLVVGEEVPSHDTMSAVAAMGRGYVLFDLSRQRRPEHHQLQQVC